VEGFLMMEFEAEAKALAQEIRNYDFSPSVDPLNHPGLIAIADALRRAYEAGAASGQEWQPIETAPKDGLTILAGWRVNWVPLASPFNFQGKWLVSPCAWVDGGWWSPEGPFGEGAPTHYIPWGSLPQPPQEGE
jgi:hypothetical protein